MLVSMKIFGASEPEMSPRPETTSLLAATSDVTEEKAAEDKVEMGLLVPRGANVLETVPSGKSTQVDMPEECVWIRRLITVFDPLLDEVVDLLTDCCSRFKRTQEFDQMFQVDKEFFARITQHTLPPERILMKKEEARHEEQEGEELQEEVCEVEVRVRNKTASPREQEQEQE